MLRGYLKKDFEIAIVRVGVMNMKMRVIISARFL
jgi:hypothetical protein